MPALPHTPRDGALPPDGDPLAGKPAQARARRGKEVRTAPEAGSSSEPGIRRG